LEEQRTNHKAQLRLSKLEQPNWWTSSGASPHMLMETTQLYLYILLLTTQLDSPGNSYLRNNVGANEGREMRFTIYLILL